MQSASNPDPSTAARFLERRFWSRPWWLLLVPLFLLGPLLVSGARFLPQIPAGAEPLRSEDPLTAQAADAQLHYTSSDRIFPALTDQYAMGEAVGHGALPTWEPNLGLGIPLMAQSIAGPTYPPNWLTFFFSPEGLAAPLAALSLCLAGLGAWLFLRRSGFSPQAACLGAVAFQLGGWGIANLYLFMKVDAALYLPWCLWSIEGLAQRKRHAGLALSLSLGLTLLAGFLPIGVFVAGLSGLYALVRLTPLAKYAFDPIQLDVEASAAGRTPALLSAGLFALLGLGLGTLAIWPLLEVSGQSERQGQSQEQLVQQALPSQCLLGVPLLDLFGDPKEPTPSGDLPVAWWLTPKDKANAALQANQLEWNTYAGAAVLALALVGLIAAPRRAALPACLLLLVFGFAMAWPPLRWLYTLPGLDAGAPMRSLALAWFLWPWLAAIGLDAIARQERRAMAALALIALGLIIGAGALWLHSEPRAWTERLEAQLVERYEVNETVEQVRQKLSQSSSLAAAARLRSSAVLAGAMGLLLFWCAAMSQLRGARRALELCLWMLICCIAAEGLVAARGHISGQQLPARAFPASASIEAVRQAAGAGRVIRYDPTRASEVVTLARPNMLQPYGIADLTPWVVFPPRSYNELFGAFDPDARFNQGFSRLSDPALLDSPILDLFGVTAVLSKNELQHKRLEPVLERPGLHVYRRLGALGRARLVGSARMAPSDLEAPALLASGEVDLQESTLLSAAYLLRADELLREPKQPGRISAFRRDQLHSVQLTVEDAEGGFLVLHEQHYPGWRARLNGHPAEILRTDHVYQALRLEPGLNEIEFEYHPDALHHGLWISTGALLLAYLLSRRLTP